MSTPQLPDRPNLDNLKKQAKSLLHAAQGGDLDALRRFATLPAFRARPAGELQAKDLALHDAQSVIARELGFVSWNTLRDEVEARTLSFDDAIDEFVRSATGGVAQRAERLLALHPGLTSASLYAALVVGDAAAVDGFLREHPERATQAGGPRNWEPLLYVCHTTVNRGAGARLDGLVAIARQLCAAGANPNAEYHWNWHPELPRTALWGAVCVVGHLPLAEVLLAAGANPTDGVTSHIISGGGNVAALDLLQRFGLDVNGKPGGVPPLVYMMQWADRPEGVRWLLEHGADANLAWGAEGEAPLHVAVRRWDVSMVEGLVQHGADVGKPRADGRTPHTLAELYGNRDAAAWLLAHGARDEMSTLERFIAACARADRDAATTMLDAHPALREQLGPEHQLLLHRHAESGNAAVLETMLACGFDPRSVDKDRVTPLHRAAMGGHLDATRMLIRYGADVNALDGMFAASPLVWAVEGRSHDRGNGHYVAVARALIDAGASLEWTPPSGAPSPERTLEGLTELRREVAALNAG